MNSLAEFMTDRTNDIKYENLVEVDLDDKGKPTRSLMWKWSQEERTSKFFEFCNAYDKREDSLLRDNYQQFSHRLHWDECPFVDEVKNISDPEIVLHSCLLFSFTNEHWKTYKAWASGYNPGLKDYLNEGWIHQDILSDHLVVLTQNEVVLREHQAALALHRALVPSSK